MIRKAAKRAAIWTAGVGMLAAPMTVMSPQISLAACQNPGGQYPRGINSQTTLKLDKSMGRRGTRNRATSTVSSNQGTPNGTVVFFVNNRRVAARQVDNDGTVSMRFGKKLRARKTHTVQARFKSNCPWNNSNSPKRYYTVKRR